MSDEKKQSMLEDMSINIELTIRGVNVLLAMLDRPQQIPTTMAADMMSIIHQQAVPQIEKAKAGLDAALAATKENPSEPKATS